MCRTAGDDYGRNCSECSANEVQTANEFVILEELIRSPDIQVDQAQEQHNCPAYYMEIHQTKVPRVLLHTSTTECRHIWRYNPPCPSTGYKSESSKGHLPLSISLALAIYPLFQNSSGLTAARIPSTIKLSFYWQSLIRDPGSSDQILKSWVVSHEVPGFVDLDGN